MAKHEPTLQEFRAMWSLAGLDSGEFDVQSLHIAWCSLQKLMQRMQPVHQDVNQTAVTPPQSVFDPVALVNRGES